MTEDTTFKNFLFDRDSSDTRPHFDIRISAVIEDSELYRCGYRSEVFIGNAVTAYRETPKELAERWHREGG
jgi:hypothetical protein